VDDRGRDIDIDNLSKMELFQGHPLALKIAGTPASVRALTLDQLRSHFQKNYVSKNVVFAAAGRIDRNQVLELVEESFRAMPAGETSRESPPPLNHHGPSLKFVRHDESQTGFRLTFCTVPEQHEDFPALQLIRRILDDGLSSRLPFNVVEKRGLAYSLHAGMEAFHDVGLFDIEAACAPEKAAIVLEEICRTLGGLSQQPVLEEELARAKRRHRMQLEFIQDSPGELAGWFGGTELFRVPETFDEHRRKIDEQGEERIRQVAQRYFSRENLSVVAVGPKRGVRALERAIDRAEGLAT
jgi:predicted Zn-dependent peptidase